MPPPLQGRRIVVTRAPGQADSLCHLLAELGAEVMLLPTIAIAPPLDWGPLDRALAELGRYSGFIFTSGNAVQHLFRRAGELHLPTQRRAGAWVCAIGPATAAALAHYPDWKADILPASFAAEGVVAALSGLPLAASRILLARGAGGRDLIPEALSRRCALVDAVATHRAVVPLDSEAPAREAFPGADAVLFTSSSTARNLAQLLGADYRLRLHGCVLAALGPVTRRTVEQELGLTVAVQAPQATAEALAQALVDYWHA